MTPSRAAIPVPTRRPKGERRPNCLLEGPGDVSRSVLTPLSDPNRYATRVRPSLVAFVTAHGLGVLGRGIAAVTGDAGKARGRVLHRLALYPARSLIITAACGSIPRQPESRQDRRRGRLPRGTGHHTPEAACPGISERLPHFLWDRLALTLNLMPGAAPRIRGT